MTTLRRFESTWGDARYWLEPVAPRPAAPGAALNLLSQSIEQCATVIAIGALMKSRLTGGEPTRKSRRRSRCCDGWLDRASRADIGH